MKAVNNGDFFKSSTVIKIVGFVFVSLTFFYFGKYWSDGSQQLIFFNSRQYKSRTVALSPNFNKSFDLSTLIKETRQSQAVSDKTLALNPPPSDPEPIPPPPPTEVKRFGIVDENGTMADDFEVGDFDPDVVENWGSGNKAVVVDGGGGGEEVWAVSREYEGVYTVFGQCGGDSEVEFDGKGAPIPWPRSRDEMVPDMAFGQHTRVVLDVGCGVASFGAYLISRNVLTMSVAPKDVHEYQIQFALERGVPAMVVS
ncbi:putative methyltransferase family protein [Actinidia rufa]|uniref:Methyltransferase n=1 Tax=Actinidia rufa TaxID=165716 RepID=A0A7J0FEG3_9ERIC|nr:putative methyltransferase family protein [Actinidia rufa]